MLLVQTFLELPALWMTVARWALVACFLVSAICWEVFLGTPEGIWTPAATEDQEDFENQFGPVLRTEQVILHAEGLQGVRSYLGFLTFSSSSHLLIYFFFSLTTKLQMKSNGLDQSSN